MSPKKTALWFLIISVTSSAALGIVAILSGDFDDFEARIILTTLTVSAASVCALACGALWEKKKARALPSLGVTLAIVAAFFLIAAIWMEPFSNRFWKFTASVSVLAAATAQACLVSLAKLAPRFVWARVVALGAIFFLAVLTIFVIYSGPLNEGFFKMMGATAIVVGALTVLMPIFHRLSRADLGASVATTADSDQRLFPTVLCPRCGTTQPNSSGEITCTSCGCRFVVTIIDEDGAKQI